jgi:hypothetical protein
MSTQCYIPKIHQNSVIKLFEAASILSRCSEKRKSPESLTDRELVAKVKELYENFNSCGNRDVRARYCSAECQREAWSTHKKFRTLLALVRKNTAYML